MRPWARSAGVSLLHLNHSISLWYQHQRQLDQYGQFTITRFYIYYLNVTLKKLLNLKRPAIISN